jgi:hypothetical protein
MRVSEYSLTAMFHSYGGNGIYHQCFIGSLQYFTLEKFSRNKRYVMYINEESALNIKIYAALTSTAQEIVSCFHQ